MASMQAADCYIIEEWRIDYNERRPHTSLRGLTPNELATRSRSDQKREQSPARNEGSSGARSPATTVVTVTCVRRSLTPIPMYRVRGQQNGRRYHRIIEKFPPRHSIGRAATEDFSTSKLEDSWNSVLSSLILRQWRLGGPPDAPGVGVAARS